jgi:NADH dehydrogenase [ubiquinone] 1 alpha subcomplex assembly factor 7
MAACNSRYYATRDPFGVAGDFITAPEISQMFGEIIGGWVGDLWVRAGRQRLRLVELGPGRGTLMGDLQRVCGKLPDFAGIVSVNLVETSPVLRAAQAKIAGATWFDSFDAIPDDGPIIVIANEFFDALPIRQFSGDGRERAVIATTAGFAGTWVPTGDKRRGEAADAGAAIAAAIGARLHRHGGAALIIDYGHAGGSTGDSLQALRCGAAADPFADPGEADLTTHVDFAALAAAAGPVRVHGPLSQGVWLTRLGIEARAAALQSRASRPQAAAIAAALVRLTAPTAMGGLFKAMALSGGDWPPPAGFDA